MSEAPKRIWAESVEGKWRNGSWSHSSEPAKFPDEREYIRADIADEVLTVLESVVGHVSPAMQPMMYDAARIAIANAKRR